MILKVLGSSSKGNCYIIENEHEALILEAGVRFLNVKKALNFNTSKIVGCLVTHQHGDHAGFLKDFIKEGIPTLALREVYESKEILSHNAYILEFDKGYQLGGFKVIAFRANHDVPCAGYIIEHPDCGKVLFLTDSFMLKYRFKNLNQILIECNYSDDILEDNIISGKVHQAMRSRLIQSHMELQTTKKTLLETDLTKVQNIVLIHPSDGNGDKERFESEVKAVCGKRVCVAVPNMEISFNLSPF